MAPVTVYIVRHGETEENRRGVVQGQLDTELNATGHAQAARVAEALRDVPFAAAYASDLARAAVTAEIILKHHPGVPLRKVAELRERYMGERQGRTLPAPPDPPEISTVESADALAARGAGVVGGLQPPPLSLFLLSPFMPPSETTPLIGANGSNIHGASHQPTWAASLRWLLLGSWFNVLLIFVPLSVLAHTLNWDAGLRFLFSFIAIVPLAKLLGDTTEQMSLKLGQTLAGLLNATFGNAVEIIVGLSALLQGQIRIVQTSMLGSIISNILLVLGCSFLAATPRYERVPPFFLTLLNTDTHALRFAQLMTLACITLVIPAAYHSAKTTLVPLPSDPTVITPGPIIVDQQDPLLRDLDQASRSGLLIISRGTALLLLAVYVAYLFFQLKTHHELFRAKKPRKAGFEHTIVDAEAAGAVVDEEEDEEEQPDMNLIAAGVSLLTITVITSFVADFLVASIEETADRYHIPKPFIGLILLPIVANAAEHVTSVWMAMKDKMELTIGICVGSSIQIATFVVPLLVIVGWISGHELTLFFDNFETVSFFVSVLLVNLLIQDGKSNYMEGLMLITLYLVIALAFWVS
ncbi:hypothetical protein EVG20_g4414 [Dentipellis fragilis]|uniref:Sodium/calcium exchanger membrane region domain-containing protein n=1 Tax=Dentipellis fragilis TaxID=205917 RepID=A0A4Y9YY51_9AGAM|nr:hypothetical protein EVG20_g4414 [Dentipellis fragilis]